MKPTEPNPRKPSPPPGPKPSPNPGVIPKGELWWHSFEDLKIEKEILRKLKSQDPGQVKIPEEYFDQLHDKILKRCQPI